MTHLSRILDRPRRKPTPCFRQHSRRERRRPLCPSLQLAAAGGRFVRNIVGPAVPRGMIGRIHCGGFLGVGPPPCCPRHADWSRARLPGHPRRIAAASSPSRARPSPPPVPLPVFSSSPVLSFQSQSSFSSGPSPIAPFTLGRRKRQKVDPPETPADRSCRITS